jgi:hypothetical protein
MYLLDHLTASFRSKFLEDTGFFVAAATLSFPGEANLEQRSDNITWVHSSARRADSFPPAGPGAGWHGIAFR